MSILNKIIECEIEYLKCFCKANEQQNFIRFQDNLMPDMYCHNYTWVKSINDDNALLKLIESEINYSKNAGKNFCLIRCHIPIGNSILTQLAQLPHKPEVSLSGYYVFGVSNLPNLSIIKDCSVVKVKNDEMIEDFAVSPQNQRKGYGTTILKSLIEIALERDADIVYSETDEGDAAKEMYKKCGLFKMNDFTDLLFNF